jgi:hypothetical protein
MISKATGSLTRRLLIRQGVQPANRGFRRTLTIGWADLFGSPDEFVSPQLVNALASEPAIPSASTPL